MKTLAFLAGASLLAYNILLKAATLIVATAVVYTFGERIYQAITGKIKPSDETTEAAA